MKITWSVYYPDNYKPISDQDRKRIPSVTLKRKVLQAYDGKCVRCGCESNLHIDHIIPYSHGGLTVFSNLQVLCNTCNHRKTNYDPHEDPYLLSKDLEF